MAKLLDLPINSVRYDRCCICLEYGQMANSSCCQLPRHTKCEYLHQMAHLNSIHLLPNHKQLQLPCSVCKQTWKVISIHDPIVVTILRHLTTQLSTVSSPPTGDNDRTGTIPFPPPPASSSVPSMIAPPLPAYSSTVWKEFTDRTNLYRRLPSIFLGMTLLGVVLGIFIRGDTLLRGNPVDIGILSSLIVIATFLLDFVFTVLRVHNQRIVQRELEELNSNTAYMVSSDIPDWAKELAFIARKTRHSSRYRLWGGESSADMALDALETVMHHPNTTLASSSYIPGTTNNIPPILTVVP